MFHTPHGGNVVADNVQESHLTRPRPFSPPALAERGSKPLIAVQPDLWPLIGNLGMNVAWRTMAS
jgi:hypothetical protein